ncbi:acyl carrier protein [Entomoplasma freundtii]|uniref:Acyl carrier protein n=1 Tax=Entomoplasma freundtii TaxID=74700 RepID=A0A2K8NS58_9MOLU|nr:acyl carrier protein [Entomoplasma freundtii]ATZ16607.1 acyl carrier protein [Entomoplasma freundtii]TDY58226.1 acyl carrier protein [Entomoplasma freundtii]
MKIYDEIIKTLKARGVKQSLTKNSRFQDLGIDSLDLMDMVIKMEKQLNIRIADEDLLTIKTIGDLTNALEKLLK